MRHSQLFLVTSVFGFLAIAGACSDSETEGSGAAGGEATTTGMADGGGGTAPTTTTIGGNGGSGATGGSGGSGGTPGTCVAPTTLTPGDMVSGNTINGTDNLTATTATGFGPCQQGGANEAVFELTASEAGFISFTLSSATDQGMYIRTACDDGMTELTCSDANEGGTDETLGIFVEQNEVYSLVVDGFAAGEEGPFNLSVSTIGSEVGLCMDGMDNNGDGVLFDCADPTCIADSACIAAQAAVCAAPTAMTPGTPQNGDTTDGSSDFGTDPICTALSLGKVDLFNYAPTGQNELVGFQLTSATDQGLFIRTTCTDRGTQVACRDAVLGGEEELVVVPMADSAAHSVFVAAYEGGEEGAYTLTTTVFPHNETEPNDMFGMADPAVSGDYGHLSVAEDVDWFTLTLGSTTDLTVQTADVLAGDCAEARIDSEIELFMADGSTSIAFNDDIDEPNNNYCSLVSATGLAAGTYLIRVRSSEAFCETCTMGYQLNMTMVVN